MNNHHLTLSQIHYLTYKENRLSFLPINLYIKSKQIKISKPLIIYMKWINKDNRLPIKSWCENVEAEAMVQAQNLANHPETFHHIALMPDCHSGYGMPIGGVIACEEAIIPNAVGVDIGCGMCAVKTTYKASEINGSMIKQIIGTLRNKIPVGFDHHKREQNWQGFNDAPDIPIIQQELKSARKQLGTLGGGNHFIEVQAGIDGYVWLMVHSGSRNFGYKIAREYNSIAQKHCERYMSIKIPLKGENGLAFLPLKTKEAKDYISAMDFALGFARENRKLMMSHLKNAAVEVLGCSFDNEINIHHNFAAEETHFRKKVWVHRKGATEAKFNQMGIIPGSMGTASYITKGLGNPESYSSCSHGAGRVISRSQFNKTYTVEECNRAMEGIVFGRWNRDRKGRVDISEAPQAYKDIDTVMENQNDLVETVVKLRPLGVMKG